MIDESIGFSYMNLVWWCYIYKLERPNLGILAINVWGLENNGGVCCWILIAILIGVQITVEHTSEYVHEGGSWAEKPTLDAVYSIL